MHCDGDLRVLQFLSMARSLYGALHGSIEQTSVLTSVGRFNFGDAQPSCSSAQHITHGVEVQQILDQRFDEHRDKHYKLYS